MIIKSLFGGAGLVLTVGWFVWVLVPQDSCERIERSGSVVRGVGNVLRDVLEPRVNRSTALDMIRWSIQADQGFKGFVANQFFRGLDCSHWSGRDLFIDNLLELLEDRPGDDPEVESDPSSPGSSVEMEKKSGERT